MDEVILITAEYSYCRVKKCSYFKESVLNAKSMQAQRYNREAAGLEGKALPEVKVTLPEEEDFPERTERYIKNKIMLSLKQANSFWTLEKNVVIVRKKN